MLLIAKARTIIIPTQTIQLTILKVKMLFKEIFFIFFFVFITFYALVYYFELYWSKSEDETLNFYFKNRTEILISNDKNKKITFCKPPLNYGYGNRIYTFLSSFTIALLSDSAFILIGWNDITNYIDFPFDPFDETYNNITKSHGLHKFDLKNLWKTNKNTKEVMSTHVPNKTIKSIYTDGSCYFMKICSNPIYYDKLLFYKLVSKETIANARNAIKNKIDEKQLQEYVFKIGYEVGGNLLNKIWIPKQRILNVINYYIEKEFKDNFVIGLQLRFFYLNSFYDIIKFINCAHELEKNNTLVNKKTVKWFLSSDSDPKLNEILRLFPNKAFSSNGTIDHIVSNTKGYERVIIDIELLSYCDELITTGGSTFGFVAAMKSLKIPFYVDGFSKINACKKFSFSNPSKTPKNIAVF